MATVLALLFVPQTGEARTLAQANGDADYYSAVDCPHHTLGKCVARNAVVTEGIGGGRWRATTYGWECGVYDLYCHKVDARWYYYRTFIIENNGSRSNVSPFRGDG